MAKKLSKLGWGQRFRLIEEFNLADDQVCELLSVAQHELDDARNYLKRGVFKVDKSFDVNAFGVELETVAKQRVVSTTIHNPITNELATATRLRSPKKRGRKGVSIKNAFRLIPIGSNNAVPASHFSEQHNVSLAVLRQAKRFDSEGESAHGKVRVKQDKETKMLMIWRDEKS